MSVVRIRRVVVAVVLAVLAVLAVRVGSSESALVTLNDPSAWMSTGVNGTAVQINPINGDVVARSEVGDAGDSIDAVSVPTGAVVLNRNQSTLVHLDGATHTVTAEVDTARAGRQLELFGGVEASVVYLAEGSAVQVIDPDTLATLRSVDVGEFIDDAVIGADGVLWGRATGGTRLHRVSTEGLSDRSIDADAELVLAGDRAVLVDPSGGTVVDLGSGRTVAGCLPQDLGAGAVAGGSGSSQPEPEVVVADPDSGRLVVVDLALAECTELDVGLDVAVAHVVVHRGVAYLADEADGVLLAARIDGPDAGTVDRFNFGLPGQPVELFERHGTAWLNEPAGAFAAVLDDGGIVHLVDKVSDAGTDTTLESGTPGEGASTFLVESDEAALAIASALGDFQAGLADDGGLGTADAVQASAEVLGVVEEQDPAPAEPTEPDALVANFTYSAGTVRVNEPVTFRDRSTGNPTSWTWTFGDGTTATDPDATKAWSTEGTYVVSLTVDRGGESSTAQAQISVLAADAQLPPVADFAFSSATVEVGQPVTFTSRSTGDPTSHTWDFGDGSAGTGRSVTKQWSRPGTYVVTLTVSNAVGTDRTSARITVLSPSTVERPAAAIAASATSVQIGQAVTFASTSSGNPTSLRWTFGDGTTGSGATVRHAWDAPGTYEVRLEATNSAGSSSATTRITVSAIAEAPVARLEYAPSSPVVDEVVTFTSTSTNRPTTLSWNFGDGDTGSGATVNHRYTTAGTYQVTLVASNDAGSSTTQLSVRVAAAVPPPVASFTVAPATVRIGDVVTFSDTSTGSPTSWSWNFGDGSAPSAARNPAHVFDTPGTYTVTLTATNSAGSDQAQRTVTVLPPAPSAAFTYSPATPRTGQTVQFTDTSTGRITSWSWDFGDGATSTLASPTHAFTQVGTFDVTLTVQGPGGTDTATQRVSVSPPPPTASFSVTPASPRAGVPASFTDTSSGSVTSWSWDFGDGGGATGANPTHTYAAPGTYTVVLTVTGPGGSDTATRSLVVRPAELTASFVFAPADPIVGQAVTFTDTSAGPVDSWQWSFGNGATSTSANPSTTYASPGTYTVTLTVSGFGATSTTSRTVTVSPPLPPAPTADFTFAPADPIVGAAVAFTDASAGVVTSWVWDFGDGAGATGAATSHAYAAPGTYAVTLTVTGPGGADTRIRNVVVAPAPTTTTSTTTTTTTTAAPPPPPPPGP